MTESQLRRRVCSDSQPQIPLQILGNNSSDCALDLSQEIYLSEAVVLCFSPFFIVVEE